jgi:hypothetical protein
MARNEGLQETNEPWKKPGQTAENSDMQPSEHAVEQEKNKKGIEPGAPNPLNPASRTDR